MNYVPWFEGDYLRDTMHLTWLEDLAYRRLLGAIYSTERPLPSDEKKIFAIVRANTPAERAAVRTVLKQFFHRKHDRQWYNKRAMSELSRLTTIRSKRVNGGKQRAKQVAHAKHMLSSRVGKPSPSPSPSPETSSIPHSIAKGDRAAAASLLSERTAAAFSAIGFDRPFGPIPFQQIWISNFEKEAEWVTIKMEATIQECQDRAIGIPPQFYEAKRVVEADERIAARAMFRRSPL